MPSFWGTAPNLNFAVNRLNHSYTLLNRIVSVIQGITGGLQGGSGAAAPNANVEKGVQWAIAIANDDSHGYSQSVRWGPSYDCSSFITSAMRQGGFNIGGGTGVYTGNMIEYFTAAGFTWHPAPANRRLPASMLRRGDIMLNTGHHTQMYIGNNQDVNAGSTKNGIYVTSHNEYYTYGSPQGWDGFLRYEKTVEHVQ